MLFAKHGYAHARLDKKLQAKTVQKRYYALVKGSGELDLSEILLPDWCVMKSQIITRKVAKGWQSMLSTSYQVVQSLVIFI